MKALASYWLRYVALALLASLLVVGLSPIARSEENPPTASLIVRMAQGLSAEEHQAVIRRNGGEEKFCVPQLNLHMVEIPAADVEAVMQKYRDDPAVVSVELNTKRKVEWLSNDTWLGDQWDLLKISWDVAYGNIALNTTGYVSKIAVIDTGVAATHPDLANMVVPGMSIFDPESNGMTDPHGHGTWLAGIAAAQTNNGEGIAGVAYGGVKIMPVQVIDANGEGQDSDIITGVMWAVDHGADVILMGFSNPGFSDNLQLAIDYAWEHNVVLVAAVGNDALGDPTYPAGDAGVMGVSATDADDALAFFSNFGPATFIAAPGVNIMSTTADGIYAAGAGSSASSAVVAGAAALLRAVDPTLTNGAIVGRLARNADPAGDSDPKVAQSQVGNGRINLFRALSDASTEEVKPTGARGGGPFVGPYRIAASITLNPVSGPIGTNVTVSGSGYSHNSTATISVASNAVAICSTDAQGKFSCSFTFPAVCIQSCTVTATDGSNSKGTTFTASQALSTTTITVADATYDGNGHGGTALVTGSAGLNQILTVSYSGRNGTSYELSTTAPIVAGNYIASANFAGNAYYTGSSDGKNFAISKASSATVLAFESDPYVYRGTAFTATAKITGIGDLKPVAVGYCGECTNVTSADCCMTTYAGDTNHEGSSDSKNITISKADAACTFSGCSGFHDGLAHGATGLCSGIGGENAGTLDLGASFTNVPGGTAHWIFTGNGNYNDGSGDASIIIQSWTPKGFYRPVDMPTTTALVWNSIKGGSTVPLKFNIFAGITEQKSTSAVNSLSSQLVACTNGINNEIDQTELPTPNRRYQPSL